MHLCTHALTRLLSLLTIILSYNGHYTQLAAVQMYNRWASQAIMVGHNTRTLLKFPAKEENVWSCYLRRYQDKFSTQEEQENQPLE